MPAYSQVTLDKAGNAEYREAADDELPLKFPLAEADTEAIFTLADKLDHFKRPLESGLKVAFMGKKTFRWENGDQKSERAVPQPAFARARETGARQNDGAGAVTECRAGALEVERRVCVVVAATRAARSRESA